jgi:hypothetical protein
MKLSSAGLPASKILPGIVLFLATVLLAILAYGFIGVKTPSPAMNPANLTVVSAPDQKEAMEHPDFVKEEYVPVVPEGKNLAPDGIISASSFTDVYPAIKAVDGNVNGPSYWEAKAGSYPNTLSVKLSKASDIHAVRVRLNPEGIWGKRTQTFSVSAGSDGDKLTEIVPMTQYTFDPDRGNEAVIEFNSVNAQYVQLEFTENSGAAGAQAAELEIYGN